jgi:hypothetical protein
MSRGKKGDAPDHDLAVMQASLAKPQLKQLQILHLPVRIMRPSGKQPVGEHEPVLRHEELLAAVDRDQQG